MIVFNDGPSEEYPHGRLIRMTSEEATRDSREAFKQARPTQPDERSDDDVLEEFIIVNGAWVE